MMPILKKIEDVRVDEEKLIALSTKAQTDVKQSITQANQDLVKLNQLIDSFNNKDNRDEKIQALTEIYQEYNRMNHQYSMLFMEYCPDYQKLIHEQLFTEIQNQYRLFGLPSLPVKNEQEAKAREKVLSPLPDILTNMPPDKVNQLLKILSKGKKYNIESLKTLFAPSESGYSEFEKFLSTHSISFLGGGNSKNFKIVNTETHSTFVLKVENRFGLSKEVEDHLRNQPNLAEVFTPVAAERYGTYLNSSGQPVTRALLITDFCGQGDIDSEIVKTQSDQSRLKSALNIYTQMATTLESMRKSGCAFPDMKNSNWLLDENRKLQIADTKSFLFTDANGDVDRIKPTGFVNTIYMNPWEFETQTQFSADKMHAYMLGLNLYHYLTNCNLEAFFSKHEQDNWVKKYSAREFDFSAPIFKSPEGEALKKLILNLVRTEPANRISVDEALTQLEEISLSFEKNAAVRLERDKFSIEKQHCNDLFAQAELLALETYTYNALYDIYFNDFPEKIEGAKSLAEITLVKNDLENLIADLNEFKDEKADCHRLVTELDKRTNLPIEQLIDILKEIEETTTMDDLLAIKRDLEVKLQEIDQIQAKKDEYLDYLGHVKILAQKTNSFDTKMEVYVRECFGKIQKAGTIEELHAIKKRLSHVAQQLEMLSTEKDDCKELLRDIAYLAKEAQVSDATNDSYLTIIAEKIEKAVNVDDVKQIKTKLNTIANELDKIRAEKENCASILNKIEELQIKTNTKGECELERGAIQSTSDLPQLAVIKDRLEVKVEQLEQLLNKKRNLRQDLLNGEEVTSADGASSFKEYKKKFGKIQQTQPVNENKKEPPTQQYTPNN